MTWSASLNEASRVRQHVKCPAALQGSRSKSEARSEEQLRVGWCLIRSLVILSKHHQKLKCARLMQVRGNAPSYCFIRKVTRKCLVAHTRPRSEPRIANEGPKKPLTIARWRWRAPPRPTLRRGLQLPCAPGRLAWAWPLSLSAHLHLAPATQFPATCSPQSMPLLTPGSLTCVCRLFWSPSRARAKEQATLRSTT